MAFRYELPVVEISPSGKYGSEGGVTWGWGGTGDAWDPHGTPDISSGFFVSGGYNKNQDPVSSGGTTADAVDAHYYSGYWAGAQEAMYRPQSLPSSAAPFLIPGLGEGEPFPIPNAHTFYTGNIVKALTSVNPNAWGRNYAPLNRPMDPLDPMSPYVPWDEPWARPPWVLPKEWPQIEDPYISASGSAFQRVNPELNYDEQAPGNFIIDNIERLIFDPIRPMTNVDAAFIGHSDITPGTGVSSTTPANIPSNIFPGDVNSMWGLGVDFGGPRTNFGDGIIDSTGFFLDQ